MGWERDRNKERYEQTEIDIYEKIEWIDWKKQQYIYEETEIDKYEET